MAKGAMIVRPEGPGDSAAITAVIDAAFAEAVHSGGNEAGIVEALRTAGALTVSMVAVDGEVEIIGHVAISPVEVNGKDIGWYGLAPVSVRPDRQSAGVGTHLVETALDRLKDLGAHGCVVLGEPGYYGRFGFRPHGELVLRGVPAEYFQALALKGDIPVGQVTYHPAFGEA